MNTLIQPVLKTALLSASLLVTTVALAQQNTHRQSAATTSYYEAPTFEMVMYPSSEPNKLWLTVEKPINGRSIHIDILDARGHRLESSITSRRIGTFRQRFDLSKLDDGTYTFRISDGEQTQERSFRLATPGLEEQLPQRYITLVPQTALPPKS